MRERERERERERKRERRERRERWRGTTQDHAFVSSPPNCTYRGASTIKRRPPPRNPPGPQALAYGWVLEGYVFL